MTTITIEDALRRLRAVGQHHLADTFERSLARAHRNATDPRLSATERAYWRGQLEIVSEEAADECRYYEVRAQR